MPRVDELEVRVRAAECGVRDPELRCGLETKPLVIRRIAEEQQEWPSERFCPGNQCRHERGPDACVLSRRCHGERSYTEHVSLGQTSPRGDYVADHGGAFNRDEVEVLGSRAKRPCVSDDVDFFLRVVTITREGGTDDPNDGVGIAPLSRPDGDHDCVTLGRQHLGALRFTAARSSKYTTPERSLRATGSGNMATHHAPRHHP